MANKHQHAIRNLVNSTVCNFNQQFYDQLGVKYSSFLKSSLELYQKQGNFSNGNIKIEYRIKSDKRFLSKLMLSKHDGFADCSLKVHDIVGVRLIFNNIKECEKFRKIINHDVLLVNVSEEKNYIQNPKIYGYRSMHLIGLPPASVLHELKSFNYTYNVQIELQLRTKLQHFFSRITYWRHIYDRKNRGQKKLFLIDEVLFKVSELFYLFDNLNFNLFRRRQVLHSHPQLNLNNQNTTQTNVEIR